MVTKEGTEKEKYGQDMKQILSFHDFAGYYRIPNLPDFNPPCPIITKEPLASFESFQQRKEIRVCRLSVASKQIFQ